MEKAGKPLSRDEREMLDYIDGILRGDEVLFNYCLKPSEIMVTNNLRNLHGRTAFTDARVGQGSRELRRIWLWRRHGPIELDPIELDRVELEASAPVA